MIEQRRWRDLTTTQKRGVAIVSVIQFALLLAALVDIRRRPSAEINGSKRFWSVVAFVNFAGPLAYFLLGRKHTEGA